MAFATVGHKSCFSQNVKINPGDIARLPVPLPAPVKNWSSSNVEHMDMISRSMSQCFHNIEGFEKNQRLAEKDNTCLVTRKLPGYFTEDVCGTVCDMDNLNIGRWNHAPVPPGYQQEIRSRSMNNIAIQKAADNGLMEMPTKHLVSTTTQTPRNPLAAEKRQLYSEVCRRRKKWNNMSKTAAERSEY
ncbi:hypothetical protein CEXT_763031 [Caerostris extrusa]|uniref:Uncharacterized protein n=1 Tax=Caerostris extrusa TaxID=172846 RepID=A0AAV4NX69_CAEEX|nr:hypothetical protein CEXT_763031 [Caerostris extrusa]